MTIQHKELAKGRWSKFSIIEQLAHIGSEISRALNWRAKENQDYCDRAVERALELIDLTLCSVSGLARKKEMTRIREALLDFFYGQNEFSSTEESWRMYFDHFAYAARKSRSTT